MKKNDGKLIAVSGGIGSGKSVICKILSNMGYPVYDCDSRAKILMDNDEKIKNDIIRLISPEVVTGGCIDRKALSRCVFNDADALDTLNGIVHSSVRADLINWKRTLDTIGFVETAILYQSGIDKMVDEVWEVMAPMDIRVERVMSRSNMSADEVMARIKLQDAYAVNHRHARTFRIINDGLFPVLPQVCAILSVDY